MNNDNFHQISVIIPVHNNLPLLENTIKSLMSQSFRDFELIIVDDGSNDNSSKVASEILKNSGIDFQLFQQVNSGVSVARNKGLMNAKGKFIYFLDGDDWIESNCLEELHKCIIETKSNLVTCGFDYRTPEGKILKRFDERFVYPDSSMTGEEYAALLLLAKTWAPTGGILWDKSFLDKTKIKYTPGAFKGQDVEFTLKNISKASKVSVVKKTLTHYVIYDNGRHDKVYFRRFHSLGCMLRLEKYLIKTSSNSYLIKLVTSRTIPLEYLIASNFLIETGFSIKTLSTIIKKNYIQKRLSLVSIKEMSIKQYFAIKLLTHFPKLYSKLYKLYRLSKK